MFRAAGLLMATFLPLAAQTAPPNPAASQVFTLPQALALANLNSPQLRAALAGRAGASGAVTTARAYPNPIFNTLAGHQYARPIATPGVPGLLQHYSVDQLLELPGLRQSRIQAAEIGQESRLYALEDVQLAVTASVKHAFYDVLRREEEIEHAQENLVLVQDLRRRIQVQVDVGEAARLELTRADAEIAIARTLVKTAQLEFVVAISALRAVVSSPLPENINPEGDLDQPITLPPLDVLREQIRTTHPAIVQAETEVRRSKALLGYEYQLRKPQPAVRAEYEHQPDLAFYRFGVSIPVPVWNRREGPIAEAKAQITQAESFATLRRLEITAALERAYGQYQLADQQITSFQTGALRQAESALRAAEAAYRFGERGILEVLDAQRVLRSVRADLLDAQFQRQAALIDLEQLRAIEGAKKP